MKHWIFAAMIFAAMFAAMALAAMNQVTLDFCAFAA
jgi:hypothetical protein